MEITGFTHWDNKKYEDYFDRVRNDEVESLENPEQIVTEYFVKNKIYVSPTEHQHSKWGVPIIDNKYLYQVSLRYWGGVMANVWNIITGKSQFSYLDFYLDLCNDDSPYKESIGGIKFEKILESEIL